jgi:hypothetical protein
MIPNKTVRMRVCERIPAKDAMEDFRLCRAPPDRVAAK